jgi:hypothetical protein
MSSRALLDRGRPPISGGGEVDVRQRLRKLMDGGVLPGAPGVRAVHVWAGNCRVQHPCTICGVGIDVGEMEFEMTLPAGVVVVVHQRCFDLWTRAAAADRARWPHRART